MKKEDIEKAANIFTEDYVENGNLRGFRGSHRMGFIVGANWRINSVWHSSDEMPEKKFALVEYPCFPKGHGYLVVPDPREVLESITRYAYIEDLMPDMEE